jgi:site-specific DNA-adenine methylase
MTQARKPKALRGSSYCGGKGADGTYQTIINQIPPHHLYCEPFAGNASICRHLKPAFVTALCEIDEAQRELLSKRFPHASIYSDGFEWLESLPASVQLSNANHFVYMDPPYPMSSRSSGRQVYLREWTDQEHVHLLRLINGFQETPQLMMAVSTYPNEMYAKALKRWRRIEFQSQTRGGPRTEWLFMNYDTPERLHDYRYLGNNKREREVIRKRCRSLRAKLVRRPPLERYAALAAIEDLR